jgi:hypothetical protein
MRRILLSMVAALGLLVMTADTADARPRWGVSVGYGGGYWGAPGYSVSYGTRVGDGFVRVGYSSGGWGYPGYGYYSPGYYYSTPSYYYSSPVYYSTPRYYGGYYTYPRRGWGWGW